MRQEGRLAEVTRRHREVKRDDTIVGLCLDQGDEERLGLPRTSDVINFGGDLWFHQNIENGGLILNGDDFDVATSSKYNDFLATVRVYY